MTKSNAPPIPKECEVEILKLLHVGEDLIWIAAANPKRSAIAILPQAATGVAFFCVFLVVFLNMVSNKKAWDFPSILFAIVFFGSILSWLFFLIISPAITFYRCKTTAYAVTNKRIITCVRAWPYMNKIIDPKNISSIKLIEANDGFGDLTIDCGVVYDAEGSTKVIDVWHGVADVLLAENAVQELLGSNTT